MNTIWEIAASLSESFILVRLCNRFLSFKNHKLIPLKSIVFFIFLALENIFFGQHEKWENTSGFLLLLLILGYSILFFQGKIYEKFFVAIIPAITILPINLIILAAFRALSGCSVSDIVNPGGKFRVPVLIFSKLSFFFVCEIIINIRKRSQYSLSRFQWFIQLSCFFITFMIAYSLLNISLGNDKVPFLLFVSIMIAIINILLYIMMEKIQHDSTIKEAYKVSQINLTAQEKFVDEAREHYVEMKTLRHDMRHYLTTASELISTGQIQEAKTYLEKIIEEKVTPIVVGIDTGNIVINAVINNKISACQKKNIEIKCMIDSQFRNINEMDISILLSNLLDNAINGCAGTFAPKIELTIGTRKSYTYIIVKNSIPASVLSTNPNLETNKKNKSIHGYGIISMQKIIEKYNGSIEFQEENNTFIIEIWLETY